MNTDLAHDLHSLIEAALRGPFGDGVADPVVDAVARNIADRLAAEVDIVVRDMAQDFAAGVFVR